MGVPPNTHIRTWVSHLSPLAPTNMGVLDGTPFEHGCPHRHPNTGVLSPHEDGCPFGTHMGTHEHGCPFGQTSFRPNEHGCPQRDPNMGVLSALSAKQIWVSPRRRRWVSFPHRQGGVPAVHEHGCPLAPISSGCSSQRAGVHGGVASCRGPWAAGVPNGTRGRRAL